jgi:hypothetical protein
VLLCASITSLAVVLLFAISYLAINHHMPLHRAGLTGLAAMLAAHPLRWSAGVALVALLAQIILVRRVGRAEAVGTS